MNLIKIIHRTLVWFLFFIAAIALALILYDFYYLLYNAGFSLEDALAYYLGSAIGIAVVIVFSVLAAFGVRKGKLWGYFLALLAVLVYLSTTFSATFAEGYSYVFVVLPYRLAVLFLTILFLFDFIHWTWIFMVKEAEKRGLTPYSHIKYILGPSPGRLVVAGLLMWLLLSVALSGVIAVISAAFVYVLLCIFINPHSNQLNVVKVVTWVAVVLLIVPYPALKTGMFVAGLVSRDIAVVDDIDLLLDDARTTKDQNGFVDIWKAIQGIYDANSSEELDRIDRHYRGEEWDDAFVANTLIKNKVVFGKLDLAATREEFQNPTYSIPYYAPRTASQYSSTDYYFITPYAANNLVALQFIRAKSLIREGKDTEALNSILKLLKMPHEIGNSQMPPLEYTGVWVLKVRSLEALSKLAGEFDDRNTLVSYIEELDKLRSIDEGLVNALKYGYQFSEREVNEVENSKTNNIFNYYYSYWERSLVGNIKILIAENLIFRNGNGWNSFYFKPNKTKSILADSYRKQIDFVENGSLDKCEEVSKTQSYDYSFYNTDSWVLFTTENIVGKIIFEPKKTTELISILWCENEVNIVGTQMILAVRVYNLDTGNYPNSLEELVPKYLPRVPIDPYDGKPMKYLSGKKIIYSVGPNLANTGDNGWDWATFKIDF